MVAECSPVLSPRKGVTWGNKKGAIEWIAEPWARVFLLLLAPLITPCHLLLLWLLKGLGGSTGPSDHGRLWLELHVKGMGLSLKTGRAGELGKQFRLLDPFLAPK